MARRSFKHNIIGLVTGLALFPGVAATRQAPQEERSVEQVHKNIQALKGMPSSQLLPVMHYMRTSLGVRCDYCHVAENGKYWMDDKPAKQIARKMLQMVFDINKANFGGQPVVTCNTCHRGSTKPIPVPAIGQGAFTNTTRADDEAKVLEPAPTADQVFDKYIQALGGKAAVDRVKTRTTKATLLRPKLINSGAAGAVVLNRAESWTIETFQKAPNKYLAVITTPDGVVYQGFNGAAGWTKTARGQREMSGVEVARVKRQADLYNDLRLREQYSKVSVTGKEKIDGQEVYVLDARSLENKAERLYFDVKTGFLLRRTVFTEIKLGLDPEQTDYEDYRAVDDVWLPFTVRTSYLDDNHFGVTRTLTEVKQNLPIDDARFDAPVVQR
jgi:photosynthetic reaction center cytochrome c subunit